MADEGAPELVRLRHPTQCALWEHPELALGKFSQVFEVVEEFDDDRHLSRSLWKCRECGQLYFREWYEWVDWDHGNDKTYVTLIPVQTRDEIAALKQTSTVTLLSYYPRLQLDESRPTWVGKD